LDEKAIAYFLWVFEDYVSVKGEGDSLKIFLLEPLLEQSAVYAIV
jgi:hypothetical protein